MADRYVFNVAGTIQGWIQTEGAAAPEAIIDALSMATLNAGLTDSEARDHFEELARLAQAMADGFT